MLLPRLPGAPEEDPRLDLARRLQEYERIKKAAETLHEIDSLRAGLWARPETTIPRAEGAPETLEVSLFDLIEAFRKVTERYKFAHPAALEIHHLRFSVADKMVELVERLEKQGDLPLLAVPGRDALPRGSRDIFPGRSRADPPGRRDGLPGGGVRGDPRPPHGGRVFSGADPRYLPLMATESPGPDIESAEPAPARPRETRAAKIVAALEALLFSSPGPVKKKELADILEATPQAVSEAIAVLQKQADVDERGVRLEEVAGGWRYVTRPEFDSLLRKFHEITERSRLSLAALETLAVIAYRQPITLPEIQEVRGVNSASVLNTLLEKRLVTTAGRKAVVGTPFLYRTTPDFLVRFGLNELEELPKPEELAEDLAATAGESPQTAFVQDTALPAVTTMMMMMTTTMRTRTRTELHGFDPHPETDCRSGARVAPRSGELDPGGARRGEWPRGGAGRPGGARA